ncbi:MAG TPA: PQQ-dependent sugar dehydrogenase [Rhodanobacteraceae bacterium]|nr:PQQ-dependent sugar dehydrogenase [Rhodanobacteraceae bacterium]
MRSRHWLSSLIAATLVAGPVLARSPSGLRFDRFPDDSTTFAQPIGIRAPNDGSGRVFIIERCDDIVIVKNGAVLSTPFLSVDVSCNGEQGILGLAFDPAYASNGTFYVSYSAPDSDPELGSSNDHVLARYTVSANPDVANPNGEVLLRVPDIADNHNGGDLAFDSQGYLNWSVGDGGVQEDPNGFAQCTGRKKADNDPDSCYDLSGGGPTYYLMGKILRLDVHDTTASAPANFCGATPGQPAPYAIPPGNPFGDVGAHPDDCAEIFNWGFRNPFRFSFDRDTGDMLIGDVGQYTYEEVSLHLASSGGQNFQWNECEGFHSFPGGSTPCAGPPGSIPPKLDYSHSLGCAVVGGFRYRGPIAAIQGQYFFSDNCSGDIYVVADADNAVSPWTFETMSGTPSMSTYSFGEDQAGNLYVADGNGPVYVFHSDTVPDVIFQDGFDG